MSGGRAHARAAIALLALAGLAACGGAVTDPLAGRASPATITGDWYTVDFRTRPPTVHRARIEGAGAPLYGEFTFPLHGREWYLPFRDAEWNGRVLTFTTRTDFGFTLPDSTVHWAATRVAARGARGDADYSPARLTLQPYTVDGPAFGWDFLRAEDVRFLYPDAVGLSRSSASGTP